jgi:hypothetical protein
MENIWTHLDSNAFSYVTRELPPYLPYLRKCLISHPFPLGGKATPNNATFPTFPKFCAMARIIRKTRAHLRIDQV